MWRRKNIDVDVLDTTYWEIITTFVLNTMLHNVGMLCIIENQEELKYDMGIKIQIGWQMFNDITHLIIRNSMENYLRDLL